MGRKKRRKGVCVYCGKEKQKNEMTDHHVPPQCLFAPNAREHLIKVPCCTECHSKFSKDDEYFKVALAFREDMQDHLDVQEILPSIMRSIRNPNKLGFRISVLSSLDTMQLSTPSGLLLPYRKGVMGVNGRRLERVAQRIIHGLFYHETTRRLPDEYEVNIIFADMLRQMDRQVVQFLSNEVILPVSRRQPKVIGRNVFGYKVMFCDEDPNLSTWLLGFYNKFVFVGLILKKEDARKGATVTS